MSNGYVLYNKKAGKKRNIDSVKGLTHQISAPLEFLDIEKITNYPVFMGNMKREDFIILCGGDGTLNRFINNVYGLDYKCDVLYYPNGTGNDFAHGMPRDELGMINLTEYIRCLPRVTVNGREYSFINGVGYGIDGYCCDIGDQKKEKSDKPVNYTAIAVKGLLFHYRPTSAKITIDGVTHTYKKVWLAPTMFGKYYGGGMMPTPEQDRASGMLSTMVFYRSGKLKTLMIFPTIFKGTHVKHKKHIEILKGQEITVEFDRPRALQIDGETILGVTSYTASVKPAFT